MLSGQWDGVRVRPVRDDDVALLGRGDGVRAVREDVVLPSHGGGGGVHAFDSPKRMMSSYFTAARASTCFPVEARNLEPSAKDKPVEVFYVIHFAAYNK